MGIFLILAGQISHLVETMIVRARSKKAGSGGFLFNAFISFFSMLLFVVTDKGGLQFPPKLWLFGLISGCMYAGGFYFMFVALKYGSFGISKLLMTFVAVFPITYGLLFLKEEASVFTYVGICLALAAVFMTNYTKGTKEPVSKKWVLYMVLTILCNGGIAILTRMQQITFDAQCDNEFLILSLGLSFLILLLIGIFQDVIKGKQKFMDIVRNDLLYSIGVGATNGLNNLTSVMAYRYLAISVATPLKSGIGIVLGFLVSVLLYKEKFNKMQFAGMAVSLAAVILLQL